MELGDETLTRGDEALAAQSNYKRTRRKTIDSRTLIGDGDVIDD